MLLPHLDCDNGKILEGYYDTASVGLRTESAIAFLLTLPQASKGLRYTITPSS